MTMTNEEYLGNGGNKCPFCGGGSIDGGTFQSDNTEAWRYCSCDDCGSEWEDLYKMTGYNTLNNNVPDNSEQLLNEVIEDAVDTCVNDTGYLRSLLRYFYSSMSYDEIRKLHNDAFDNDE
jgi:formate dehydrogenase maturation protein FdhE